MKKEKLTLEAVKQDLMKMVNFQLSNKTDWRFSYIVPITLLAVTASILLKNVFVGLLIFSIAAYHILRYVIEYREHKQTTRLRTYTHAKIYPCKNFELDASLKNSVI